MPLSPLPETVRVASVPFDHVYIHHLAPLPGEGGGVTRLADPRPNRGDGTEQSGWWPPAMLEPGWIDEHADEFDLMHLHFGFDALTPQDIARVIEDLHRHAKPLVYTAHDLRNPHHTDPALHAAALDVLVPGADALITLTRGAAAEIERRWGRTAQVIPHPHVLELDDLARRQREPRRRTGPFRVGVHLKSLRPNMASLEVIDGLVEAASRLDEPAVIQVNTHPDVMEGTAQQHEPGLPERLEELDAQGAIDLQVHPFFSDDELWDYLASLDASVLPYRWGTHSGWLEACSDLGTGVIAPDCGYYADQRPVHSFHLDREGLEVDSLAAALADAVAEEPGAHRIPVEDRRAERRRVVVAHEDLYRSLLGA